jgi:hypothetical protein
MAEQLVGAVNEVDLQGSVLRIATIICQAIGGFAESKKLTLIAVVIDFCSAALEDDPNTLL